MRNPKIVSVVLDLVPSGLIRGWITDESSRRSFYGWLELAGALEAARSSVQARPGDSFPELGEDTL